MKEVKSSSRVEFEAVEVAEGVSVKYEKTQNDKGLFVNGVINKDDREVGRVSLSEESDRMYMQLSPLNGLKKDTVVKVMQQITEGLAELMGVELAAVEEEQPSGEGE